MSETEKPTKAEDEYFARQEMERRKKWAAEQSAKMKVEEKEKLRQLHWMRCPKDGTEMTTIELHGIKLDKCPTCNGTFFDDGEIEHLMNAKDGGLFGRVMSVFR